MARYKKKLFIVTSAEWRGDKKYVTILQHDNKDFFPGCGREEKGADKCQKDKNQQLGKSELAEINAKSKTGRNELWTVCGINVLRRKR